MGPADCNRVPSSAANHYSLVHVRGPCARADLIASVKWLIKIISLKRLQIDIQAFFECIDTNELWQLNFWMGSPLYRI